MTRKKPLRCALLLPLLFPAALALGEVPVGESGEWVRVPGELRLSYQWRDDGEGPEVVAIRYSGTPEWLVNQEHPRSHWHELRSLERIEITHTSVTEAQIQYISQLDTVEYLEFFECVYEGNALVPLEQMTGLKVLGVDFSSHTSKVRFDELIEEPGPEFFAFLGKLVNLEYLNLRVVGGVPIGEETFRTITELENLRGLSVWLQELDAETLRRIGNLSKLGFLSVGRLEDASPLLEGLRGHARLAALSFRTKRIDENDVASLASLASLKVLSMEARAIASLAPLENLTNLTELSMRFNEYEAVEFDWLSDAPQLEVLMERGPAGAEIPLEPLRGHEGIRRLWLPAARLSEDDIAILESMPRLERLRVGNRTNFLWHQAARKRLPDVTIRTRDARTR